MPFPVTHSTLISVLQTFQHNISSKFLQKIDMCSSKCKCTNHLHSTNICTQILGRVNKYCQWITLKNGLLSRCCVLAICHYLDQCAHFRPLLNSLHTILCWIVPEDQLVSQSLTSDLKWQRDISGNDVEDISSSVFWQWRQWQCNNPWLTQDKPQQIHLSYKSIDSATSSVAEIWTRQGIFSSQAEDRPLGKHNSTAASATEWLC